MLQFFLSFSLSRTLLHMWLIKDHCLECGGRELLLLWQRVPPPLWQTPCRTDAGAHSHCQSMCGGGGGHIAIDYDWSVSLRYCLPVLTRSIVVVVAVCEQDSYRDIVRQSGERERKNQNNQHIRRTRDINTQSSMFLFPMFCGYYYCVLLCGGGFTDVIRVTRCASHTSPVTGQITSAPDGD